MSRSVGGGISFKLAASFPCTCYGVNYDITYRLCFINISLYYWETTQMGFASVSHFSGLE